MKVWNITCKCGHDKDYSTISLARKSAAAHKKCSEDGKVFIDQVETNPGDFDNYQTGKTVIV